LKRYGGEALFTAGRRADAMSGEGDVQGFQHGSGSSKQFINPGESDRAKHTARISTLARSNPCGAEPVGAALALDLVPEMPPASRHAAGALYHQVGSGRFQRRSAQQRALHKVRPSRCATAGAVAQHAGNAVSAVSS
jgi:hypothetical protein